MKESGAGFMETVSIRDLTGAVLHGNTRKGKPVAITNYRALIGVFIPVAAAWVEHLIEHNWSHVRHSIADGERAMASGLPMADLTDIRPIPGRLAIPLIAAMSGRVVTHSAEGEVVLRRLLAALTPGTTDQEKSGRLSTRTVRTGQLTATVIEQAGMSGQTIAVTYERELIGIVIPVTPGLVQYLVEQNLSRVLYNVGLAERTLSTADQLTTSDELIDQETSSQGFATDG